MLDRGDALNGVKRSLERNVGLAFKHTWRGGKLRAWKAVGASTHAEAIGNVLSSPRYGTVIDASYAMTPIIVGVAS